MPRYFFNLYDDMVFLDEEGKDLPTSDHAREEAVRSAKEIACAEVVQGHLHLDHRIEVADAFGEVIDTIWFREIVQVSD